MFDYKKSGEVNEPCMEKEQTIWQNGDDTVSSDKQQQLQQLEQQQQQQQQATLKVKWSNSLNEAKSLILKMNYTDTIGDLRALVKSKLIVANRCRFDLACVYPRKTLDNPSCTLEQAGLVPNSNVLLIPRRK